MMHQGAVLYPTEVEIAIAVLGNRAAEWPKLARYLEDKHNFPRVDTLLGGRSWAKVEAFFRRWDGLDLAPPVAVTMTQDLPRIRVVAFPEDGKETPDAERAAAAAGRWPARRARRTRARSTA